MGYSREMLEITAVLLPTLPADAEALRPPSPSPQVCQPALFLHVSCVTCVFSSWNTKISPTKLLVCIFKLVNNLPKVLLTCSKGKQRMFTNFLPFFHSLLSLCSPQPPASPEATHHHRTTEHFSDTAPECHPGVHGHRQSQTHHLLEQSRQQVYWRLQHQSVGKRQPHYHGHQAPAWRSLYVQSHHTRHAKLYCSFSQRHSVR